jgi:hypothetical protein
MAPKYTQWQENLPNGSKIDQMTIKYTYQHLPLQDRPKFTQIELKFCHLAILIPRY